jgi:hypothetical protein
VVLDADAGHAATGRPDLRVASVSLTSIARTSRVRLVVVNGGPMAAPASQVSLRFSRSRVTANAGAVRVFRRVRIGRLAAGGRATRTVVFTRPRAAAGRFLFACADGLRRVRESSEANNCRRAGTREGPAQQPPGGTPTTPPPPPPPAVSQPVRNYAGTLSTTIRYLNFCGAPSFDETTQVPSTLTIGPPVSTAPLSPQLPPAVGGDANPLRISLGQPTAAASSAAARSS